MEDKTCREVCLLNFAQSKHVKRPDSDVEDRTQNEASWQCIICGFTTSGVYSSEWGNMSLTIYSNSEASASELLENL